MKLKREFGSFHACANYVIKENFTEKLRENNIPAVSAYVEMEHLKAVFK